MKRITQWTPRCPPPRTNTCCMCFTSVCEPVSVWACECVCIYFFSLNHLKVNCRYHDTSLQKTCLSSVQFSSVPQSCPTLCNPVNHSMPFSRCKSLKLKQKGTFFFNFRSVFSQKYSSVSFLHAFLIPFPTASYEFSKLRQKLDWSFSVTPWRQRTIAIIVVLTELLNFFLFRFVFI